MSRAKTEEDVPIRISPEKMTENDAPPGLTKEERVVLSILEKG